MKIYFLKYLFRWDSDYDYLRSDYFENDEDYYTDSSELIPKEFPRAEGNAAEEANVAANSTQNELR